MCKGRYFFDVGSSGSPHSFLSLTLGSKIILSIDYFTNFAAIHNNIMIVIPAKVAFLDLQD